MQICRDAEKSLTGRNVVGHRGRPVRAGLLALLLAAAAAVTAPAAQALPSGYAWEMVSPPDKAGGEVATEQGWLQRGGAVAADGSRVAYTSRASFAGAPANVITNSYMGIAPAAGQASWSTLPIAPLSAGRLGPVSSPGQAPVLQTSEDLTKVVVATNADPISGERLPRLNYYFRDLSVSPPRYVQLTPDPLAGSADYVGYDTPWIAEATPNLERLVYATTAELTPDAVGVSGTKAYVVDTASGRLTLASVLGGTPGTPVALSGSGASGLLLRSNYNRNTLSEDGSKLFFSSRAATPGETPLYMRDLDAGETVAVNAEENDGQVVPLGSATFLDATPDGRFVFFRSDQRLVDADTDDGEDLYRYEAAAPPGSRLTLITVDSEPADGPAVGRSPGAIGAGEDGQRLYFVDWDQLVAGGPTGKGGSYVYLWDRGKISFVGVGGKTIEENHGIEAFYSDTSPRLSAAAVSPSGRYMAILVGGPNTPTDPIPPPLTPPGDNGSGVRETYLYDAESSTPLDPDTVCVSCPPTSGPPPRLAPAYFAQDEGFGMYRPGAKRFLADDGRVIFEAATSLLPAQDTNGDRYDVYTYKAGRLDLISSGRAPRDSHLYGGDANLHTVAFMTAQPLVGWDVDGSYDAYVAKLGGGLPEPPVEPPACVEDQCQGGAGASPGALALPTSHRRGAEGQRAGARRCGAPAARAARLARRARALERRATRARGGGADRARQEKKLRRAAKLKRRAKKSRHAAKRLSRKARACRRAGR